jgi:endoglucanase
VLTRLRTSPGGAPAAAVLTTALLSVALLAGCGDSGGDSGGDRGGDGATGRPEAASGGPEAGTASQNGLPESPPAPANPLAGRTFYVDPANPANTQATRWAATRAADAQAIRKIGSRAVAHWLTGGTDATRTVDDVVTRATALGQVPVLVAYNIPDRDCGNFSAGGAASAETYRGWIRTVAAGIRGRAAVVIVEPDAVPHVVEGCGGHENERYSLLADAVAVLKTSPATLVYLDAGHPGWISDTGKLAGALRQAGVGRADGFSLNVSNFFRTEDNLAYGGRLSDALGGRRFVVDTSRNGAGPYTGGTEVNGGPSWCNPPGRALGTAPTTETGHPRADALLWIKRPGESDGDCRPGEPAAGQWWADYALDLANRS